MQLEHITPVILTWNEEANLRRCLDRLHWAKDVVIIDSGSTDATAAIASDFSNARLKVRPFDNHTLQWNYGIASAKTPWVLSLDADYILSPGFEEELATLPSDTEHQAFFAAFRYLVFGRALRGSLYPERAVLFRKDLCRYEQDGHTQALNFSGSSAQLHSKIDHDDRKPLSRWIISQDAYAKLEATKLLAARLPELRRQDRLRLTGWAAVPAVLLYTFIFKGALLDGWHGWFYTLQRTLAEIMLALRLAEARQNAIMHGTLNKSFQSR